ncbi:MAG: hypothetical protein O7D91_20165 [Planctomycetota bacterium]|nr:hypothetical protein [Planctomycetota bacterium]
MNLHWYDQLEEPIDVDCGDRKAPLCPRCGYDLRGSSTRRCAECGYQATRLELQEAAKAKTRQIFEVEDLHFKLRVGWWFGGLGAVGIALSHWIGLGGLGMIIGVICGVGMLGCGLQVFRAKRLPAEVRALVSSESDFIKGAILSVLGLAMIVLSVLT